MARRSRPHRPLFPRGAGVGFRAFVLGIFALTIWFADQRSFPALLEVRGVLATVLHPLMSLSASPVTLSSATEQFRGRQALAAENRQLRESQLRLNARMLKFEAMEAENRRLRQLMTSASAIAEKVLIAEIIAVNQDPYRHQITLNKGAGDGVYQGQALVDSYGVMGQVIHVNPTTATALLITDPGHGIPVEVNRTGLQTIARGGGDGRALILPFLPGNADVQVGDLLVTSGLGGRFPAGYPVGEVFDVKRGTAVHFMQASAAPTARLYQGRQVLLVWSEKPAVSAEEAAEPDPNSIPPVVNSPAQRPAVGAPVPAPASAVPGSTPAPAGTTKPTTAALAAEALGLAPAAATTPPAAAGAAPAAEAMQPTPLPRRNPPRRPASTPAPTAAATPEQPAAAPAPAPPAPTP